jgi:thioredoxin 1
MVDSTQFGELIGGDELVIVEFCAAWCEPCRTVREILREYTSTKGRSIRVIRVDIDIPDNYHITRWYNVYAVPTLMVFRRGTALWRESGVVTLKQIHRTVERLRRDVLPALSKD